MFACNAANIPLALYDRRYNAQDFKILQKETRKILKSFNVNSVYHKRLTIDVCNFATDYAYSICGGYVADLTRNRLESCFTRFNLPTHCVGSLLQLIVLYGNEFEK